MRAETANLVYFSAFIIEKTSYQFNVRSLFLLTTPDMLTLLDEEEVPKDPIKLSYWFSQNILFKQELCLRMLSFDSAIERLRFGLQQFHNVICSFIHHWP